VLAAAPALAAPLGGTVAVSVDATANVHPFSLDIFGVSFGDAARNAELFLRASFNDGEYEVKVTGKEAALKQRFRVVGADAGGGQYDGVKGTGAKVSKAYRSGRWEVIVEHDDGKGGWLPSKIRIVHVSIGSEWLIRTEDWTDRDFNDLEISVKRTASAKPPAKR